MLKTLVWAVWIIFYFMGRTPWYLRIKKLKREGRQAEADEILAAQMDRWATRLFGHIGLRLSVEGRENLPQNGEAVVFVSNHQSFLDIPILLNYLDAPHAIMAKSSLGKIPFLGLWIRALDGIFVERDDIRAAAGALREAEELINRGRSVIICPEGTRSMSSEMGPFKPGAVRVAQKTGARIVPLAINGTYRLLEGNHYRVQSADVRFCILPAIDVGALSREEQKALNTRLADIIRTAKDAKPALDA